MWIVLYFRLSQFCNYYKLFANFSISDLLFKILPSTISVFGADGCNSLTVFPNPLPPDVANKTTFFPEKSNFSKNVLTIVGATYHQIIL